MVSSFYQILVLLFIVFSFALVVAIPIVFGNTDLWTKNKPTVITGVGFWFSFVLVLAITDSLVN